MIGKVSVNACLLLKTIIDIYFSFSTPLYLHQVYSSRGKDGEGRILS
jgi:hypothetical protein